MAEVITDAKGRKLTLRPINALAQLRLFKAMGPEGSDNPKYCLMAECAAMVADIDGVPNPLPRTEGELERAIDALDTPGVAAVMVYRAQKILETREAAEQAVQETKEGPLAISGAS
ncbi:protein of unknown function (plasmid) [Rhodovastum atsumiense]|uniref:hypothetical protein n=1 Tax=Rhodovastum atsumiense TaxID=504468 RepID=UPI00193BC23B|nr:hypothetical protein [Rhodovastum atsumiense]CAH2606143.1 protein of unknown function [Rhodovastum atsumiense]